MSIPPGEAPTLSQAAAYTVLDLMAQAGVHSRITVTGTSMLPLLCAGDQVEVQHGLANLRRGDLIVFRQGDRLVVHRLLASRRLDISTIFLAKGDNRLYPDPPVQGEDILGRVVGVKRGTHLLALDTRGWRMAGWLIASVSLLWLRSLPLLYALPIPHSLRCAANRIRCFCMFSVRKFLAG